MHELDLARSVVDAIQTEASRQSFSRVDRVVLEVGALSCVDPHALEFGFDAATRGTLVEGAALEILSPPGMAQCFGCGRTVKLAQKGDPCPECGSYQLVVSGGEELKIKSLEVQ